MTDAQMRWAASHDWYLYAGLEAGEGYTVTTTTGEDFNNFNALLDRAGY